MEIADRLSSALAGRYELQEEVGSGATAIVFRAVDLRHSRPVAVKVLRPDVAHVVGAKRFLREIEISSRLTHPHILPLHDSGQAEGLLFFVMPFVGGGSLRDRMDREGPLPLEEALEITEQLASALQYAHARDVVHRDVKPENIMLSEGQAYLADLGIARAMGEVQTDYLTRTGVSIGSPLYMSPEQAAGERRLDSRTDTYSLACVLFEMLAGEPPFTGPTAQAILAKHALETVPSLRILRSAASASLERVVHKALAKLPADRFRTPTAFAAALRQAYADTVSGLDSRTWTRKRRWPSAVWATTGIAVGAMVFWLFTSGPLSPSSDVDPRLLAVLPFTLDPALDTAFLSPRLVAGELSSRFTGEGGPRAVANDSVLQAWEQQGGSEATTLIQRKALRVAEEAGAGMVLSGRVHPGEDSPVLEAFVHSVPDGNEMARAVGLPWDHTELTPILDRLTIRLLAQLSGEGRLAEYLTSRELPSVRNYLEGLRGFEAGLYARAADRLKRAIEADSSFALAGLALGKVEEAAGTGDVSGLLLAYEYQEELLPQDSTHLWGMLGSRFPEITDQASRLSAWEWAIDAYEDDYMAAYSHGRALLEWGGYTGHEAPLARAQRALIRALELRPNFVPAQETLLDAASINGDTATVKRVGGELLARNPPIDLLEYVRWRTAVTTNDSSALKGLRSRFGDLPSHILKRIVGSAQLMGQGLDDAVLAAAEYGGRADSRDDLFYTARFVRALALNRGRPGAATEYVTAEPFTIPINNLDFTLEAIFWDGDRGRAEEELAESRSMLQRPDRNRFAQAMDRCTLALWGLSQGDTTGVQEAIEQLEGWDLTHRLYQVGPICASVAAVQRTLITGSPELPRLAGELDLLMRRGPTAQHQQLLGVAANLTLATAFEELGDLNRALEAVRRRPSHLENGVFGLSTFLREEGRLAALNGEGEAAIAAYRHYLALRSDPEEELRAKVDSVRQEFARLVSAGAQRGLRQH